MSFTEMTRTTGSQSSLDQLLYVLSDARRRSVLRHLAAADRPVAREDLAAAVAEGERSDADGPVDETGTERVMAALHHAHLPKLEDAGLVERTERGVALTPTGERVWRSLLDDLDSLSHNRNTPNA